MENDLQDEVETFGVLSRVQKGKKNKSKGNKGKKGHRKTKKVLSRMVEKSKSYIYV